MAYDEGLAALLREDLADEGGIAERKMFGGLAFLLHGHMVCGVHSGGGMFRVGKANEAAALAIDGAGPMMFTGRPMGGMIEVADEALADDIRRQAWLALALGHARSLPPK
jgi:TfoX/Sxy family transcriptional regulator of competence genes